MPFFIRSFPTPPPSPFIADLKQSTATYFLYSFFFQVILQVKWNWSMRKVKVAPTVLALHFMYCNSTSNGKSSSSMWFANQVNFLFGLFSFFLSACLFTSVREQKNIRAFVFQCTTHFLRFICVKKYFTLCISVLCAISSLKVIILREKQ